MARAFSKEEVADAARVHFVVESFHSIGLRTDCEVLLHVLVVIVGHTCRRVACGVTGDF